MNLNNAIARAQRLMLNEKFQNDVERAAKSHRGSGVRGGGGGNEFADIEAALFGASSAPQGTDIYQKTPLAEAASMQNYGQNNYNGVQLVKEIPETRNPHNSKIPSAIIESFEKTPFQGDAFDISGGALSGLILETPQPQQRPAPQQTVQSYAGGTNLDFIKYVINEAVQNALKGQLNESVSMNGLKGFRIAEGNVIQFIDTKGNLYEGTLKLKKKASK